MGFGNPAAERAALEQTYEDRTDVLRPGRDREGNLTRTVYELVYGALPCALSRAQRADGETLELELVGRAVRYPTHQEAAAREKRLI